MQNIHLKHVTSKKKKGGEKEKENLYLVAARLQNDAVSVYVL